MTAWSCHPTQSAGSAQLAWDLKLPNTKCTAGFHIIRLKLYSRYDTDLLTRSRRRTRLSAGLESIGKSRLRRNLGDQKVLPAPRLMWKGILRRRMERTLERSKMKTRQPKDKGSRKLYAATSAYTCLGPPGPAVTWRRHPGRQRLARSHSPWQSQVRLKALISSQTLHK